MTEKQKHLLTRLGAAALGVTVLGYLGYQLFHTNYNPVRTETALPYTAYESFQTQVLAVRDEAYLVNQSAGGAVLPIASDGSRVAKDDTVAMVFDHEDNAVSYTRLLALQEEIAHYQTLETKKNAHTVSIDGLDQEIRGHFQKSLSVIASGKLDGLGSRMESLCDAVTSRQLATGAAIDFSGKLAALQAELASLQASLPSGRAITAPNAGYYISGVDGYEQVLDYRQLDTLTVSQAQAAMEAAPQQVASNVIGRMVDEFSWYFVCVVDVSQAGQLSLGDTVTVWMPYSAAGEVDTSVYRIQDQAGGKTVLILECNKMNEKLSSLRKETAEIRIRPKSGYKVGSSAVRVNEDGEKGVFVLRGNRVLFRKLDIIYSGSDYVVTDNTSEHNELKLYDQIIVEGKDLKDGQTIN